MGYNSTENAIPIMTSNTAPSGEASASSEYSSSNNSSGTHAYRAMNGNTTTYFATKDTTSGWLAYDFSSSIAIGLYKLTPGPSTVITGMPKSWTFEGSNDGVDWIVLDTRSNITAWTANVANEYRVTIPGMYKKYRINVVSNNGFARIAVGMFEMFEYYYDHKFLISSGDKFLSLSSNVYTNNLIPKMTSNSSPSGIASAFSELSGYEAWKAFDQNDATEWHWNNNGGIPIAQAFISYKFAEKVSISKYSMSIASNRAPATYAPKSWTFEGSNDGSNWTVLDTRTNETLWISGALREFSFTNQTHYFWYRLRITATNGSSIAFNNLLMFGKKTDTLTYLPNLSEEMFLNYGVEKGAELRTDVAIQRINILSISSSSLGSGKVFKQKIDTTKIPIKKASIT